MGRGIFPGEDKGIGFRILNIFLFLRDNVFLILHIIIASICAYFWIPEHGWLWGTVKSLGWEFIALWYILVWLLGLIWGIFLWLLALIWSIFVWIFGLIWDILAWLIRSIF
jgi:hypothetical protein